MAAGGDGAMDQNRLANVATCLGFLTLLVMCVLGRAWRDRAWLHAAAKGISCRARSWIRRRLPVPIDPIEQRVTALREQRRIERTRVTLLFCICVSILFESNFATQLRTSGPTMPLGQLVAFHVLIGTYIVQFLFPWSITAANIDLHYWWCMLLIVIAAAFQEEGKRSEYALGLWSLASGCCFVSLKPRCNVTGFVLVATATSIVSRSQALEAWRMCGGLSLIVLWVDQMNTASLRLEIRAKDSGQQLAAVKTLLGSICDIVLELDGRLRLTQHSPKLSDVLLRGSGRSMQGLTIQEFMPAEDDRHKFAERLSSVGNDHSHAEVFHAKISDANATLISMEFFAVAFVGPDTCRRYLLGMREFTDIPPLTPSPELPPMQQAPPPLQERAARRSWPGTPANVGSGGSLQGAQGPEEQAQSRPTSPANAGGGGSSTPCPRDPEEATQSSLSTRHFEQAIRTRRETDDAVKKLSLAATLMTWHVEAPLGTCCALHFAFAEAKKVAESAADLPCNPSFRPMGKWQCQRCGILDTEFRVRGSRSKAHGCRLCEGLPVSHRRSHSGASPAAMAAL